MAKIERHVPGTPSWADLMTPDPEKAFVFYGKLLGWTFTEGTPETGYYSMCQVRGMNVAGMGKRDDDAPFPSAWNIYFATEDAEESAAAVKEHGGSVVMGPMDVMAEGRLAFCADSTGAHFGLWQAKRHIGAMLVNEPGALAWSEVNTRDAKAATQFYASVMGLEPELLPSDQMEYYVMKRGSDVIHGVLQMNEQWPAHIPPHWMVYFASPNTDASAALVRDLGGTVQVEPFDTPYGRIAVVADPFGAIFSLVQLPAPA